MPAAIPGNGTTSVQDVDNGLADWFAEHPQALLVVRPDRYVAAHFDPAQAAEVTRHFRVFVPAADQPRMAA
jgi:3-(3-hydroxy-phenyl)propionate hydroxylase